MAKTASKMLLAGLTGLAAGVAIGVLFAPARGSKTRKRLKKGFKELKDMEGKDLSEKIDAFTSIFTSKEEDDETPEEETKNPATEQ